MGCEDTNLMNAVGRLPVAMILVACTLGSPWGCDEASGPTNPLPPGNFEFSLAWAVPVSQRALVHQLAADDSRLYMSTPAGITAIDASTGEILWVEGASPGLAGFSYVLADQTVVVNTNVALSGLDAATGTLLWESGVSSVEAIAYGGAGPVYATDESVVVALDPLTGQEVWRSPLEEGGFVNLAADDDMVCAERLISAPSDGLVTCFSSTDGTIEWSGFFPSASSIVLTDGRVILAEDEINLDSGWLGIASENGEIVWELADLPENVVASTSPPGMLFGCDDACAAVDASNGAMLWQSDPGTADKAPGIAGRYLFVVEADPPRSPLYVLDSSTGVELVVVNPPEGSSFCGTPVSVGHRVFVFTCSGVLHAYDIVPGET
jgi:outer membrane protein assembly factor BamB